MGVLGNLQPIRVCSLQIASFAQLHFKITVSVVISSRAFAFTRAVEENELPEDLNDSNEIVLSGREFTYGWLISSLMRTVDRFHRRTHLTTT